MRTDHEIFRDEFRSIIYQRSQLSAAICRIKEYSRFDKNGSHANAIRKTMDQAKEIERIIDEKLKGKSYDQWREFSKKLTAISSKVKIAKTKYDKATLQLQSLKF